MVLAGMLEHVCRRLISLVETYTDLVVQLMYELKLK